MGQWWVKIDPKRKLNNRLKGGYFYFYIVGLCLDALHHNTVSPSDI
jgi:hypothetical protein